MNDEQVHADAGETGRASGQGAAGTALRVFEQANGMNDFPVLKAFQEYIEAEQARARKRTLGLSIFFVVLLIVVVVTFSVIMAAVINRDQLRLSEIATRNQALSDKLLDIALRERTPAAQPVVNVQQPPTAHPGAGAALRPVLERLESLAEALKSQSARPATPPPAAAAPVSPAVAAELDAARRQQDELARQRAAVAAERARLKEEQEQLRRARVEQHRRRLYPEHYAREDALMAPPPADMKPKPPPADNMTPKTADMKPKTAVVKPKTAVVKPAPAAPTPQKKPAVREAPAVDLKTAKPISYFDEDDAPAKAEAQGPSPATGGKERRTSSAAGKPGEPERTEVLKVGTKDGEAIPWLIELPESKGK